MRILLCESGTLPLSVPASVSVHRIEQSDELRALCARWVGPGTQCWIGAEADLARSARRVLIDDLGVDRRALHASAYWKRGLDWERGFDETLDRVARAAAAAGADVFDPGVLQRLTFDGCPG